MSTTTGEKDPPDNGVPARPNRLILDNGSCSTCNTIDASSSAVCCMFCDHNFHALCTKTPDGTDFLPDNICTY